MGLYRWYQRYIYPAKEWIRQRLENNKVFFEIFSGLIIAGATVWVAIQANNIADRSNELADREIQMSYMENLPLFSLDIIQKEKGPLENGKGIEDAHIEYVLMNYGGFMAEVSSNIKSLIEIKIYEQNSLLTKEEVNSKTLLYYVNLPQFYKPYSYYDYSDNTLTFKSYFFDYRDMIEILRTNLKADGKFISIKHIQEVQLYYKDVYGKNTYKRYVIENDALREIKSSELKNLIIYGDYDYAGDSLELQDIIDKINNDVENYNNDT